MERYHSTAGDPPSRDMTRHQRESMELEQQIAEFLASGGKIQVVGAQMREEPEPFVINPQTTPVYNDELPAVAKAPPRKERRKQAATAQEYETLAVKIIVEAALGSSVMQTARSLGIPVARCQAIADQHRVQFHG